MAEQTPWRASVVLLVTISTVAVLSCADKDVRRFDMTGQVVAVDAGKSEITLAHDAIPGYMAAMTMSFRAKDASAIATLRRGDLVRGRLVVTGEDGFLESVERIGYRELEASAIVPGPGGGHFILEGDPLPDLQVVDQTGRRRPLLAKAGSATVLTFIYTRCPFPTFCPLMDRQFATLQRQIAGDPQLAGRVQLVSLTIDPTHDTPAVLRAHAERVSADPAVWSFAIPEEPTPGGFAARFGVTAQQEAANPDLIIHNLATVVVSSGREVAAILRGNDWTVDQVMNVLRPLAAGGERASQ